jgi:TPR repeat protein
MFNLAQLLAARGDSHGAEAWYLKAAENGDGDAMSLLGQLLQARGDSETAEAWYLKAAEQ